MRLHLYRSFIVIGLGSVGTLAILILYSFCRELPFTNLNNELDLKENHDPMVPQTLRKRSTAITRFIYHALHKTGSDTTRSQLRRFCRARQLRCLTYADCGLSTKQKMVACFGNVSRKNNSELNVQFGSFTMKRIEYGCCERYKEDMSVLNAIIEHFPLNVPDNMRFIDNTFSKKTFRFTILRDPIDQFISYWNHLYNDEIVRARYPQNSLHPLAITIDLYWNAKYSNATLRVKERIAYEILCNAQAVELGWSGDPNSFEHVLGSLDALNFVGLTEYRHLTWHRLRLALQWPRRYFRNKRSIYDERDENGRIRHHTKSEDIRNSLSDIQLKKLKEIQSEDFRLYTKAVAIFNSYRDRTVSSRTNI